MYRSYRFNSLWMGLGLALGVASLVVAGILMSPAMPALAAKTASSVYASDANAKLPGIVGSWLVTTTVIKQDATFPSLLTFTSDGIVLADEPPSPFETTGHGAWEATGKDIANFTFLAFVGSESGPLSATIKVVGSLQYDAEDDTWQGPFKVQVTGADGSEMLADTGTFDARRIAVEPLEADAEEQAAASMDLEPGDKVGDMVLVKGPDPLDLNIPPILAFCNANPQFVGGSTIGVPGLYTVECSVPPLPQVAIGYGFVALTKEDLEQMWPTITTELYLNGKQVDQGEFGRLDATVPTSGAPGEDPNKVFDMPLRTWNVQLQNLQPGPLELRYVSHLAEELKDSQSTMPPGTYDITYKITVDPSLAAAKGEPAPVDMIPEQITVFDAFNAATNAHDVDKALGLFADDAVASFPNQPAPNEYKGRDAIRTWLEADAKDNIHVDIENSSTSADSVKATAKVHVDSLPPDLTLVGAVEVTVEDGKITSFTYTLDDETLAKLAELEGK